MRIQKYISETGFCSRRQTERLILAGRITVNGEICGKNTMVSPADLVLVDGESIPIKQKDIYIALNKPRGITCTAHPQVEGNIMDFVNFPERIFPIGRLDKDSEGLILLTNDGGIVNGMMRSEHNHEKEYVVTVNQPITDLFLEKMAAGVDILQTRTKPCKAWLESKYVFRIILTQGLNRQIRRMCKALGYEVEQLRRVRIMNIQLDDLREGAWRHLTESECKEMKKQLS